MTTIRVGVGAPAGTVWPGGAADTVGRVPEFAWAVTVCTGPGRAAWAGAVVEGAGVAPLLISIPGRFRAKRNQPPLARTSKKKKNKGLRQGLLAFLGVALRGLVAAGMVDFAW